MAVPVAVAAAKTAINLLLNKKTRKGCGCLVTILLAPFIVGITFLIFYMQVGSRHNNTVVEACFYGGSMPEGASPELAAYVGEMQESFGQLDICIDVVNDMAEDGQLDSVRIKAVFFSLFFGLESPARQDHRAFVDCFVTYEERERPAENGGDSSTTDSFIDASSSADSSTSVDDDADEPDETETYIVAVPIASLTEVYQNISDRLGITAIYEQQSNAQDIYYLIAYGGLDAGGDDWLGGLYDPDMPFVSTDGFNSPVGPNWQQMVSSEFGPRTDPLTGEASTHRGMDFTNYEGFPIVAALDGIVIYVRTGEGSSYGQHLAIDHGGGFVTLYAHNSKIFVAEGDTVTAGQLVAEMGSTGRVTGSHLHFEVSVQGVLKDPREYLPAA